MVFYGTSLFTFSFVLFVNFGFHLSCVLTYSGCVEMVIAIFMKYLYAVKLDFNQMFIQGQGWDCIPDIFFQKSSFAS